ncbi:hypothetical protein F5148DRAFT_1240673 [Russula earlei]|uniref:Uncharacterized protein n=2 Tax=Russula earlei TaxID=71964 RepID=A0ACC0TQP6_9AGAM|nr:hypothetical protein F5148DRAFT_1269611 [Russula earlei]KAI9451034.1 hypothetical protein F5148DRAFT_1240673 [Russula earlei]
MQGDPKKKILGDRPESDVVPPLPFLFKGFGLFHDIFKGRHYTRALNKMSGRLQAAVGSFSEAMTRFYENDASRRDQGLATFNDIFVLCDRGCPPPLMPAAILNCQTDGRFNGPHGIVSCVVEFRNELVDSRSISTVELLSYVVKSHTDAMVKRGEAYRWRVPCLGLRLLVSRTSLGLLLVQA